MRFKQNQQRLAISLLTTYAAFVFVSWQFNPATWPQDARFAFLMCSVLIFGVTKFTDTLK
jgi:hypothetical protein